MWQEIAAQREAAFGNTSAGKEEAVQGLKLYPASQGVEVGGGARVCPGRRYGRSRVACTRPEQSVPAGHARAVTLAASDACAAGA